MIHRASHILFIHICIAAFASPLLSAQQRICPYESNPFYWQYKGKPVLLLGGSDEDNLFNNPRMMIENLDALKKCGGNYIRCTLSCRDEGNVWPFMKVGQLYDLKSFNPDFWDRLRKCCEESLERDIILQIEIWATFDFYRDNWLKNPWNPALNSNYTVGDTRLKETWNYHPAANPQPFFYSPPAKNDDRILRTFQEAFVRKVLDVTQSYPNVLYCLDNETATPSEWAWYWGAFIRKEAEERNVSIQLTEMWDNWDIRSAPHRATYERPDLFSYTDVSQNNWQDGQTHYDRLMWYRSNLSRMEGGPRPMNNVKVYARQGGGQPNSVSVTLDRWWQNIFAGCAGTRFHRPDGGIGLNDVAQKHIRAARAFTSSLPSGIFRSAPRPDLLEECDRNEAYCLAVERQSYALYFPDGGEVVLKTQNENNLTLRWFDLEKAAFLEESIPLAGPRPRIKTPSTGRTWLALVR
jgi:hypothetical protein